MTVELNRAQQKLLKESQEWTVGKVYTVPNNTPANSGPHPEPDPSMVIQLEDDQE